MIREVTAEQRALGLRTLDAIDKLVKQQSLKPFQEMLAVAIKNQPSEEALAVMAAKHPQRYMQYVVAVAGLVYPKQLEVKAEVVHKVDSMSDMELVDAIESMQGDQNAPIKLIHSHSEKSNGETEQCTTARHAAGGDGA